MQRTAAWEAAALAPDTYHHERGQTSSVGFAALIMDVAPSIPWQLPSAWSFAAPGAMLQHQLAPRENQSPASRQRGAGAAREVFG